MFNTNIMIIPHTNIEYLYVFLYYNIICNNKTAGLKTAIESVHAGHIYLVIYLSIYYMKHVNKELFIKYSYIGLQHNIYGCIYNLYRYYIYIGDTEKAFSMYKRGQEISMRNMYDNDVHHIKMYGKHMKNTLVLMNAANKRGAVIREQRKQINILDEKIRVLEAASQPIPVSVTFPEAVMGSEIDDDVLEAIEISYDDHDEISNDVNSIIDAVVVTYSSSVDDSRDQDYVCEDEEDKETHIVSV